MSSRKLRKLSVQDRNVSKDALGWACLSFGIPVRVSYEVYKYSRAKMNKPLPQLGLQEYDVSRFLDGGDETSLLSNESCNFFIA